MIRFAAIILSSDSAIALPRFCPSKLWGCDPRRPARKQVLGLRPEIGQKIGIGGKSYFWAIFPYFLVGTYFGTYFGPKAQTYFLAGRLGRNSGDSRRSNSQELRTGCPPTEPRNGKSGKYHFWDPKRDFRGASFGAI